MIKEAAVQIKFELGKSKPHPKLRSTRQETEPVISLGITVDLIRFASDTPRRECPRSRLAVGGSGVLGRRTTADKVPARETPRLRRLESYEAASRQVSRRRNRRMCRSERSADARPPDGSSTAASATASPGSFVARERAASCRRRGGKPLDHRCAPHAHAGCALKQRPTPGTQEPCPPGPS